MSQQGPRVWTMFAAFAAAVVAMLAAATVAILVMFGPQEASSPTGGRGLPGLLATAVAGESALLLCVLLFARPLSRQRLRLVSAPVRPLTVAILALGTIAIGQTLESVTTLLGFYETGTLAELRRSLASARGTTLVSTLLIVGLLAGCAEELLFRGLIQTRLVARWGRVAGIVVTSVLFGLMHMDPLHSVLATGIGLWLGYATERAGSIIPAMVAHSLNNMVATLLAAAGIMTPAVLPNVIAAIVSLALFLWCARRLNRDLPPHTGVFQPPTSVTSLSASAGPQLPGA